MKLQEKWKAVKLRKKGYSYDKILQDLEVSRSTLSLWLRDIGLTPKQKERLPIGRAISRYAGAKVQQNKRIERTKIIIQESRNEFKQFLNYPLFLSGLFLYLAEGDKNQRERVKFTNSDESMISIMMRWFREICKVPESKFRIALHIHDFMSNLGAVDYWSKITGISHWQFQKVYVKKISLGQRKNILYNGTCAVVIHNKDLFRRIIGWKLAMLDFFNIAPP